MTKVISLSEEAYGRLKRQKAKGESFSDVVVRLTADRGTTRSLLYLKGSWAGDDSEAVAEILKEQRESATTREYRMT